MDIVDLEERLDRQLQRPRVTAFAAAHAAAVTWSEAVWSIAESAGPWVPAADEIECAFAVANRPVFVFGVHRSGTTLVRDLLDQHPALSVLPSEGTLFTGFAWHLKRLPRTEWLRFLGCEWLRRLANPINQQPYWLFGRSSGKDSPYVDFARALMAWWPRVEARFGQRIASWPLVAIALAYAHCTRGFRTAPPLLRWVEKTPANERFLPRLVAEFPEAKLIHVVRHPFAVYASHRGAARNAGRHLGDASRILRQMHLSYREAARRLARPSEGSYLLLRYEDLLEKTTDAVRRMASFLEIEALPVMARPTVNGIPASSNSSFDSNGAAGCLYRRPPGDTFGMLAQHDRERISAAVGDAAEKLGYRFAPLPALHRERLRLLVRAGWTIDRFRARWSRFFPRARDGVYFE